MDEPAALPAQLHETFQDCFQVPKYFSTAVFTPLILGSIRAVLGAL